MTTTNVKEVVTINQQELISILNTIENPTFTHIVSETIVKMNKGKTKEGNKENNPYYNLITKVKRGRFLIGSDYEKRVQNNDIKEGGEGSFKSQESKVGVHISKCVLFNEKLNKYYLLLIDMMYQYIVQYLLDFFSFFHYDDYIIH